jgi:hypothetical protein
MSEDLNNSEINPVQDAKVKMLEALVKKQKGHSLAKNSGSTAGSKIGAGKTMGSAPKMHRRKAGSA